MFYSVCQDQLIDPKSVIAISKVDEATKFDDLTKRYRNATVVDLRPIGDTERPIRSLLITNCGVIFACEKRAETIARNISAHHQQAQ